MKSSVSYFKMQEHVYMGIKFPSFPVHLLRLICFSFYMTIYKRMKVYEYLPVFQLSLIYVPENPKKAL